MRTTDRQLREGEPSIDEMRMDIAEHEAMNLATKDLIEILLGGTEGLENMPDIDIRDEWKMLFNNDEERIQDEADAIREGEWNSDHSEEKHRDYCLGEQESQIRNSTSHWEVVPRTPEDEEWEEEHK
jgi:hypothetical protein